MAKYRVAGTATFKRSTRDDCHFAVVNVPSRIKNIETVRDLSVISIHERRDLAQVKVDWMNKYHPDLPVKIFELIRVR